MKLTTNKLSYESARSFNLRLRKRGYLIVVYFDWIKDGYLTRPVFSLSRRFFGLGIYKVAFFVSIMRYIIEVEK
jgi:hypothetical protein